MNKEALYEFLELRFEKYEREFRIEDDPICVPHRFSKKQDIEIAGLFAAVLAWGQRKTTIVNAEKIMRMTDNSPHDFVRFHSQSDLAGFEKFVHRTFNGADLLVFVAFLKDFYSENDSLENIFSQEGKSIAAGLNKFRELFVTAPNYMPRTGKHVSAPAKNSACKRLCMYLRWFVRKNSRVDFGIWEKISPSRLICPLDVHTERSARALGLLSRKQNDWRAAEELTENLKALDAKDPVKYDFALFGSSINGEIEAIRCT